MSMKNLIIVKLAVMVIGINSFALDRCEYKEIEHAMSRIYSSAVHTEQFIGAWNNVQGLLNISGGVGKHKEAKQTNLRFKAFLGSKDFSEDEQGFLYMRGLLCFTPDLLKVRKQAEHLFLQIACSGFSSSSAQLLWRRYFSALIDSVDPIGVLKDGFPGGASDWAKRMREAEGSETIFTNLSELFQKVTGEFPQVESFFRAGEAYELAKLIIKGQSQPIFCKYKAACDYAGMLGVECVVSPSEARTVKRLQDLCGRWEVPFEDVSTTSPSQGVSWSRIATGLENLVLHRDFEDEMWSALCDFKRKIEKSIADGTLERCDDEGVVKRICSVFREWPDLQDVLNSPFWSGVLAESVWGVYANLELPLSSQVYADSQMSGCQQIVRMVGHLEKAFSRIEAFGNKAVLKEYNSVVDMLRAAFPDLYRIEQESGELRNLWTNLASDCYMLSEHSVEHDLCRALQVLVGWTNLASDCYMLSEHSVGRDLCRVLQDSLNQIWEQISPELLAVLALEGDEAVDGTCRVRSSLRAGAMRNAIYVFPKFKGFLKQIRDLEVSLTPGKANNFWRFLDVVR